MIGPFICCGSDMKLSPPQFLILISVREQKKYGYEILKELREIFEGVWEPKTGVIYPAIKRLQENGLLDSEITEGKEHYHLTVKGMDLLREVLPKMGAMMAVSARFAAVVDGTRNELGIESAAMETLYGTGRDGKLRRLREMREHLISVIEKIDGTIEKIEGENNE